MSAAADAGGGPALQRFMAERANATIVEVPASHVSFVSQPEAATQLRAGCLQLITRWPARRSSSDASST